MTRYLGLGKEANYGESAAPTVFMRVISESIKFNPSYVYHRTIEGGRRIQTAQSVKKQSSGSIKFMPVFDKGLGEILHMVFGKVNTTMEEAGRYSHLFEPVQSLTEGILPSYSLEKGLDNITGERYSGCSISKLRINANPADFVVMEAEVFGRKPSTLSLASPSFSMQDYMNAGQVVTQELGGVQTKFEAFSIDIQSGIIPLFRPGNDEIDSLDLEPVNVTATFKTRFLSRQDLDEFLNGTQKSLIYRWKGPALGTGNYSLTIELPKLNFDEGDITVSEQERLVQARSVTAMDDPVNGLIKVTLVNNVASY